MVLRLGLGCKSHHKPARMGSGCKSRAAAQL